MGRLLFLLPILAWAQTPLADVVGVSRDGFTKLIPAEARQYPTTDAGWVIASITSTGFQEVVRAIHPGQEKNLGTVIMGIGGPPVSMEAPLLDTTKPYSPPPSSPTPVVTVCEALEGRDRLYRSAVVIVGIFKSGLDETLRQDCRFQLVTGDIGWMSAIALTRPTDPPDSLRDEIEKKRQIILNSGPPGAHPRPERVTALYGRLVSPSGLTSIPCCTAPVEINAAPARLLGLDERDFRVLR